MNIVRSTVCISKSKGFKSLIYMSDIEKMSNRRGKKGYNSRGVLLDL